MQSRVCWTVLPVEQCELGAALAADHHLLHHWSAAASCHCITAVLSVCLVKVMELRATGRELSFL